MDILAQEIAIVVVGTAFFLLVAVGIIVLFLVYQKKQLQNLIQKQELQNQFQKELLTTRLEVHEHTLNLVSQEIHDNIGQILSLVKLNLSRVASEKQNIESPLLISTKELVTKAIVDLRLISKTLNSNYIAGTNLGESIKHDLTVIQHSGVYETKLTIAGDEPDFDPQKKMVIYRMAQELLNNAIKHSRAKVIQVFLDFSDHHFQLRVEDNGVGLPANGLDQNKLDSGLPGSSGTGLGNMFLRARLIGGEFSITSRENEGTKAILNLSYWDEALQENIYDSLYMVYGVNVFDRIRERK